MKKTFNSLYWKISAVFFMLLAAVGVTYIYITIDTSNKYLDEVNQRLPVVRAPVAIEIEQRGAHGPLQLKVIPGDTVGVDLGCGMNAVQLSIAAKDLPDDVLAPGVGEAFATASFTRQPSLPNARLTLSGGEDAYLASLSPAARRDVRRKLKGPSLVRVEERRGQAALELVPQIVALYEAQRNRSGVDFDQFETLTPAYFRGVLERLGDTAVVFVYLHDEMPVAFNLCYQTERTFIDKFIGFSLPLARTLNIYVLSWMTNVRYCVARRIPTLQTGQTGYAMKLHMGSELRRNWIYFRHRNPVLNFVLRLAGPLLAADRHDKELARGSRGAS